MKNQRYFNLLAGLAALLLLVLPSAIQAEVGPGNPQQILPGVAGDDNDVIAVRVLPNPNHYSAARWYKSQGFSGSPQSLFVDGYDAVRDGRTVYVNAANVNVSTKTIYTNIYLISYNQNPDFKTVDVLGQIVKHWKFNSNLSDAGRCSISTERCAVDADCEQGQICSGAGEAPGRCQLAASDACYTDSDCPSGLFCDNLRSKVARDVRRLGMLGDVKSSLVSFKGKNNKYPILGSGTYLPLKSISVWPSWRSSFLPQIGSAQSMVDPINSLGPCAGFDPITCWNEENKAFADPHPSDNQLELPAASYAFVYSGDANGSNFSLCGAMETKPLGYNTAEGQLQDFGCVLSGSAYVGSSQNLAPLLIATGLKGETSQEFNGFIKVLDPEGNPLEWSINTSGTAWTNWRNNNASNTPPVLRDTTNPNQKKIYAQLAGNPGTYNLSITVSDGAGGTLATVTPITITNGAPVIHSDDIQYYPNTVIPLLVRFSITDKHQPISYSIAKAQYNSGPFDLLAATNATFLGETSNRVGDTVNYTLKYSLIPQAKYGQDTNFVYVITAKDAFNNISTRQLNIMVKAEHPLLDFNCAKAVRVGSQYYCGLGWKKQGDHTITYSAASPLPAGLTIGENTEMMGDENPLETKGAAQRTIAWLKRMAAKLSLKATAAVTNSFYALSGKPTTAALAYPIRIKAVNEYGAETIREYSLNINNYCGDGLRQQPNFEGRGGYYNDGHEDCDGTSGIILNRDQIGNSHSNLQYGCLTLPGTVVPYPILDNQLYCVYKGGGPEEGGGYCGDGICQAKLATPSGNVIWEGENRCIADCSCDGVNQGPVGGQCVCTAGYYDCDQAPGCESNTECGACTAAQYRCGDKCYPLASSPSCGLNSNKCYTGVGTSCTVSCATGYYNCDGINGCEGTTCNCPTGYVWNNAAWPNGRCEVSSPCPSGQQLCGSACYNPTVQKCCENTFVCGSNQVCCTNQTCASSIIYCAYEEDPGGGGTDGGRGNNSTTCTAPLQPCGKGCYDPSIQQCCAGKVACGLSQYCCKQDDEASCTSSYLGCYLESSGGLTN